MFILIRITPQNLSLESCMTPEKKHRFELNPLDISRLRRNHPFAKVSYTDQHKTYHTELIGVQQRETQVQISGQYHMY